MPAMCSALVVSNTSTPALNKNVCFEFFHDDDDGDDDDIDISELFALGYPTNIVIIVIIVTKSRLREASMGEVLPQGNPPKSLRGQPRTPVRLLSA